MPTTLGEAWSEWIAEAVRVYARTRTQPVVEVTLDDGESFYTQKVTAAGDLLMFDAYPPARAGQEMLDALVRGREPVGDEELYTPRVVVAHPAHVRKIELLYEVPGQEPFGFAPKTPDPA